MFNSKTLVFTGIAFVLGIIGLGLVFSDLSANESAMIRIIVATIFFFLSGLGIGYFNPLTWMISGLSAWGAILFGAFLTLTAISKYGGNVFAAQEPPYISAGLIILFVPLIVALLGGYIGKSLNMI